MHERAIYYVNAGEKGVKWRWNGEGSGMQRERERMNGL